MGRYTPDTEEDIEQYLVRQVTKVLKGRANKYSTPGRRAAPDRILLWAVDNTAFVECKRPGESPTPKQDLELKKLWKTGHSATWVDTREKVDAVVAALARGVKLDMNFTENLHEVL